MLSGRAAPVDVVDEGLGPGGIDPSPPLAALEGVLLLLRGAPTDSGGRVFDVEVAAAAAAAAVVVEGDAADVAGDILAAPLADAVEVGALTFDAGDEEEEEEENCV